jgi:ribonucleoside-diphosphate reductase alpha chain
MAAATLFTPMSKNAETIMKARYLLEGESSWSDVCQRIARFVASGGVIHDCETLEDIVNFELDLYRALVERVFIFNSPCLFNAGLGIDPHLLYKSVEEMTRADYEKIYNSRNYRHNLSACFVVPVENSIEGIYNALFNAAVISKVGGGVGYDFSKLSHKGRPLDSGVGVASGPVSFMKLFDASAQAILQGGRRRSAQMAVLSVDHPDIMEFITSKLDPNNLQFFNISVMVNHKFMRAVSQNEEFPLLDPRTKEVVRTIRAHEVWDTIVECAWRTGDPGVLFFENINQDAFITGEYITATNPCGEIPTYSNLSCNLGHIDLSKLVNADGEFDWDRFHRLIRFGIKALDRVIDVAVFPTEDIGNRTRKFRPVGLGVMGFAHLLFKLGYTYGDVQCIELVHKLGRFLRDTSIRTSQELAKRYGRFLGYEDSYQALSNSRIIKEFCIDNGLSVTDFLDIGLRNATWNTIAPTGTCSLICDTSSGIEPVFALKHIRKYIDGEETKEMEVLDPLYEEWIKKHGEHATPPEYFVDAHTVPPSNHIKVQAAWQKYISNGVSKTINLPHDATKQEVAEVYWTAWKEGCKGVTVFRDGCKGEQVLYRADSGKSSQNSSPTYQRSSAASGGGICCGSTAGEGCRSEIYPSPRPKTTRGFTTEFAVACGTLYVTLNIDDQGRPLETFLNTGKGGVCRANIEAVSRLTSILLRSGVNLQQIVHQLKGIRCPVCMAQGKEVFSCADALARVLSNHVVFLEAVNSESVEDPQDAEEAATGGAVCPKCGGTIATIEGCYTCLDCGESKCS